jgi:tetratricopeptide (TPR) repeat protein
LEKLYNNVSGAPYHILGECYIGLRDYDKAINNLLNDLRIDGFNENQAYFNSIFSLGRIYFIKGDSDESVKYLKKFLNEYEGLKPEKLKELLNSANTETVRMLDFIESGKKIGFPRGKEPAFYDDIIEILQKRQSK